MIIGKNEHANDAPHIANGEFVVCAFAKSTCDPNWTNGFWPFRGTFDSCQKPSNLERGVPQEKCCWRYSFRWHLEEALRLRGFMIQVVDVDMNKQGRLERNGPPNNQEDIFWLHTLGDGQAIETEMARQVGIKIFRCFEPFGDLVDFVGQLVAKIKKWNEEGCKDVQEFNILDARHNQGPF